jgi:hypothetical protein
MRYSVKLNELVRVVLMDSISEVQPDDAGAVVITGSHAGQNIALYAMRYPLRAAFFNDAGVGKDGAGIAVLKELQDRDVPAGTVAHTSARIGDAPDTYANGILSYVNHAAKNIGINVGEKLELAIAHFLSHQ